MILTIGDRQIVKPINSPQDAIEFAYDYSKDPAALFDLVHAKLEGDGADWVREALKGVVYGIGNSSYDAFLGLINIIRNKEWLTTSPNVRDLQRLTVPVISIATGPSLENHLDTLRQLQHKCLLICADTAIKGLHEHGIYPHISTPVERDPTLKDNVTSAIGVTYGGSIYTEPEVNQLFDRHLLMANDECLGRWVEDRTLGYGSSTGTASVVLGLALTDGPVYLVGHDISFGPNKSHWSEATTPGEQADDTCMGNDGELHVTNHWFNVFRNQIASVAQNNPRVINVNILDCIGALIPNTLPGSLPNMEFEPDFVWKPVGKPPSVWRLQLKQRIARLPADLIRARDMVERAMTVEQLSVEVVCGGDSMGVAEALFRPIYSQYSIEKRLGMPMESVFAGVQCAMLNVLDNSIPKLTELCRNG